MRIKENLVLRHIGKEHIIIVSDSDSVDLTEVYSLNETSAWIWEQVKDEDFTIEKIIDLVQERYEVDRNTATNDVLAMIDVFRTGRLIIED